jgi:hypothetical protein
MAQRRVRLAQLFDLSCESVELAAGKFANALALTRAIKACEFGDFPQRKACKFGPADEAEPFEMTGIVEAIGARPGRRFIEDFFALVIADGFNAHACGLRQPGNGEISRSGLLTPYHATEAREVAFANQRRRNMTDIQHPIHDHSHHAGHGGSLNRLAASATLHCLSGCAIGEVLGMVLGTYLGLSNGATIALAVALAFLFGYALTLIPLFNAGLPTRQALKLAFASETASITIMEIVDNSIMLAIPGAMDSTLDSKLFWLSLAFALAVAGLAAFPVNRWLIARGRGHAVVHDYHKH